MEAIDGYSDNSFTPTYQKSLPIPPPVAKFTTDMHKRLTQLSHGAG